MSSREDLNSLVINHYLGMGSIHHPWTRETVSLIIPPTSNCLMQHDISTVPTLTKYFIYILFSQMYCVIL